MTAAAGLLPRWLRPDAAEPVLSIAGRELPIVIRRLARSRRMVLRLSPDGAEVRVSMPRWGRTAEALEFATTRRDWIAAQLQALPDAAPCLPGSTICFRGEPLRIVHESEAARRPRIGEGEVRIGGPESSMAPRLRRWLREEAVAIMTKDLADYCQRAGQATPRLALSAAQRRWGSCAPDGAIRINWRLVMAPDAVRRSVVAHEVAHLVHFDHSPAFHACLATLFEGDIKAANAWLKREGRSLYALFG